MKPAEQCFKEQMMNIVSRKRAEDAMLADKTQSVLDLIAHRIDEQVNSGDRPWITCQIPPEVYDRVSIALENLGYGVSDEFDTLDSTTISWKPLSDIKKLLTS